MKKTHGISLIVLVITIIVIVILAGTVILNLVNNNYMTKSAEAAFKSNIDTYNSELDVTMSSKCITDKNFNPSTIDATIWDGSEEYISGTIKEYIPSIAVADAGKYEVHDGKLVYVGKDSTEKIWVAEFNISIENKLKVLVRNWTTFFVSKNATGGVIADKPAEQTSTTTLVAYDMWGEPVNLDLWKYCKITSASYGTIGTYCLNSAQDATTVGYKGIPGQTTIKITGEIPAVIYDTSTSSSAIVTSLNSTFYNLTSLTSAPTIPSSIIYMGNTFYNCSKLAAAPVIPDGVISMNSTFLSCSSLTEAPEIPNNVTNMACTFYGCSKLTTAKTIPSKVTSMNYTFYNCTNLTGSLVINATSVFIYSNCLYGASTASTARLVLSGTCPQLTSIFNTKSTTSHITKL